MPCGSSGGAIDPTSRQDGVTTCRPSQRRRVRAAARDGRTVQGSAGSTHPAVRLALERLPTLRVLDEARSSAVRRPEARSARCLSTPEDRGYRSMTYPNDAELRRLFELALELPLASRTAF